MERTTRGGETRTLALNLDWVTVGKDRYILTTVRDVSERARAEAALRASEAALRASEERYRGIVETTDDGIMVGEPAGPSRFVNQRMADMLGYQREELIGRRGFDLVFPDWRPRCMDHREALSQAMVRGEFKLRRKDGTPLWTMFSSTPMLDQAGQHVGNLTMHSDITELKAAEEELRRSEERFRMVLGAAPVTVAAQDKDLRYVWAFNQRTAPSGGCHRQDRRRRVHASRRPSTCGRSSAGCCRRGSSSTSRCGSTGLGSASSSTARSRRSGTRR